MSAQNDFEKAVDAYWKKHNTEPVPVAAKKPDDTTLPEWLKVSAVDASQVALFRAEAKQPDTSPHMRARLARASLKTMGLDNLFAAPSGEK